MSNKLSIKLKKVYLSSLAGLATSSSYSLGTEVLTNNTADRNSHEFITDFKTEKDLTPKLLLKKSSGNEWSFMSHRSHRSHSSHRSHYSSTSGSRPKSSSSGSVSSGYSNSGTYSPSSLTSSSPKIFSGTTSADFNLGERTLKIGMSGTDVTELINILLRKKYLKLEDGGTIVTGIYLFDKTIESAVKQFQSDNELEADGVCGPTTVYYLKKK